MGSSTPSPETNDPTDEFTWIARLRSLTRGDVRALDLRDDAAVLPSRPGFDLVVTKDALIEGVHFLHGEAPGVVARRLLRTNLSDLAAKGAEPFGYFLMTAWPKGRDAADREGFAQGLAIDGDAFGISLLGGDTVTTSGPLVVSATMLGWVPQGTAVLRSRARTGDRLVVCGSIGDGWLGLKAARGETIPHASALANHYRLPEPLLVLRAALRRYASAAADVSDGLLADANHVAESSGRGLIIDLDALPLSAGAAEWLAIQPERVDALVALAVGGDDYALACAVSPSHEVLFLGEVNALGIVAASVGVFTERPGLIVTSGDVRVDPGKLGWRH